MKDGSNLQIGNRISSISWEILLTTLFLAIRGKLSGKEVVLISPWVSDLDQSNFSLPLPIKDEVSNELGKNLSKLSNILIELHKHGVRVRLVTHPLDGDYKSSWNQSSKDRETRFLNRLSENGVEVMYNVINHSKIIYTPVAILSGSANLTNNGFYNNQETMHLILSTNEIFEQSKNIVYDILNQSRS